MNEKQQHHHPPAISETTPSPPATTTHDPGETIEKLEALAALHSFNLTTTGASNAGATDDKSGNPLGPSGQHSSISEEEARYNRSLPSNDSLHVPVHHGVALASCTQVDSSSSSPTQSNTSKSLGDKEESELYARGKETALSHGAAQASDTALQLNESEGNAAHPSIKFHHVPQRGGPWDVTTHEPSFFPLLGTRMPLAFIWRKSTTADKGWQLTFLVAESAILQKAGAPKALGIYPCRAFKGPTTRGGNDGEELGHYGGQVLASEPTERLADAAALPFVRQGHAYLLTMRVTGQEGWHVCAGDLQSVLPFLFRVNDPKGTLLKPRCIITDFGCFRAARDLTPINLNLPLSEQASCELSFDYTQPYWDVHETLGTAEFPIDASAAEVPTPSDSCGEISKGDGEPVTTLLPFAPAPGRNPSSTAAQAFREIPKSSAPAQPTPEDVAAAKEKKSMWASQQSAAREAQTCFTLIDRVRDESESGRSWHARRTRFCDKRRAFRRLRSLVSVDRFVPQVNTATPTTDSTPEPTSNESSDPACACCASLANLVQLVETGAWYCNNRTSLEEPSCVAQVLQLPNGNNNAAIRLTADSQWGAIELQCSVSGESDIHRLGMVLSDTVTAHIVASQTATRVCAGYLFHPALIDHGAMLAPWVTGSLLFPGTTIDVAKARPVSSRRELVKAAPVSSTAFNARLEYYAHFSRLVALQAANDDKDSQRGGRSSLAAQWGAGPLETSMLYVEYNTGCRDDLKINGSVIVSHESDRKREYHGRVLWVGNSTVGISLLKSSARDQHTQGYNVRPSNVAVSYDRMQTALRQLLIDEVGISTHLATRLLGVDSMPPMRIAKLPSHSFTVWGSKPLSSAQERAVRQSLTSPLTLVQGPPGTGKTTTSASIVYWLSRQGDGQVLVCAGSNAAANTLARAIARLGVSTIRYYASSAVSSHWSDMPCNVLLSHYAIETKELTALRAQQQNVGGFLVGSHERRFKRLVKESTQEALALVSVVVCTCSAAGDSLLAGRTFHAVLIDEAAQITEPETLIPITKGCHVLVLVGDQQQLSPLVKCAAAKAGGLAISMFERLTHCFPKHCFLDEQHRMHPALSHAPNALFYGGRIRDAAGIRELRASKDVTFPWPVPGHPFFFWHLRNREQTGPRGNSYSNSQEAQCICRLVCALVKCGAPAEEIGVIAMYEAQRVLVTTMLRSSVAAGSLTSEQLSEVEVATIDAYQGRERDFILITVSRSNDLTQERAALGISLDPRRLNVSLTRARRGLVVVGDSLTLRRSTQWQALFLKWAGLVFEGELGAMKQFKQHQSGATAYGIQSFAANHISPQQVSSHSACHPAHLCHCGQCTVVPVTVTETALAGVRGAVKLAANRIWQGPFGTMRNSAATTRAQEAAASSTSYPVALPTDTFTLSACVWSDARHRLREVTSISDASFSSLSGPLEPVMEFESPESLRSAIVGASAHSATALLAQSVDVYGLTWDPAGESQCLMVEHQLLGDETNLQIERAQGNLTRLSQLEVIAAACVASEMHVPRITRGLISRIQYWWRARYFGWLTSADSVIYWRLARSSRPNARATFLSFVKARSFRSGWYKEMRSNGTWPLSSAPTRTRNGVLRLPFPGRLLLRGSLARGPRAMYRAVRQMVCGYGALACLHSARDAEGKVVRDTNGEAIRRVFMAVQSDYERQRQVALHIISWYGLYCTAVQHRVPNGLFVLGFCSPGGHAEGVRRAGFHAAGIDIADDLRDFKGWFEDKVPQLYPNSPTISVKHGDALQESTRAMAVQAHPKANDVLANYDSPSCVPYSSITALGGNMERPVHDAPARRVANASESAKTENLTECIGKLANRYRTKGEPFITETVGGGRSVTTPPGVTATEYSGMELGLRTLDRHLFYHPTGLPLFIDRPLREGGKALRAKSCSGASKPAQPPGPDGVPLSHPCCKGNTASLYNGGYFGGHTRGSLSKLLDIDPSHVTSKIRLNNLIPPILGQHSASMLGMHCAHERFGVPMVSFDEASADPLLGAWVIKRLASTSCRRAERATFILTPANLPGKIIVLVQASEKGGAPVHLLPHAALPKGGLLATAAEGLNAAYSQINISGSRLGFVCDLLASPTPGLVFQSTSLPCNDAHQLDALATGTAPREQGMLIAMELPEFLQKAFATDSEMPAPQQFALTRWCLQHGETPGVPANVLPCTASEHELFQDTPVTESEQLAVSNYLNNGLNRELVDEMIRAGRTQAAPTGGRIEGNLETQAAAAHSTGSSSPNALHVETAKMGFYTIRKGELWLLSHERTDGGMDVFGGKRKQLDRLIAATMHRELAEEAILDISWNHLVLQAITSKPDGHATQSITNPAGDQRHEVHAWGVEIPRDLIKLVPELTAEGSREIVDGSVCWRPLAAFLTSLRKDNMGTYASLFEEAIHIAARKPYPHNGTHNGTDSHHRRAASAVTWPPSTPSVTSIPVKATDFAEARLASASIEDEAALEHITHEMWRPGDRTHLVPLAIEESLAPEVTAAAAVPADLGVNYAKAIKAQTVLKAPHETELPLDNLPRPIELEAVGILVITPTGTVVAQARGVSQLGLFTHFVTPERKGKGAKTFLERQKLAAISAIAPWFCALGAHGKLRSLLNQTMEVDKPVRVSWHVTSRNPYFNMQSTSVAARLIHMSVWGVTLWNDFEWRIQGRPRTHPATITANYMYEQLIVPALDGPRWVALAPQPDDPTDTTALPLLPREERTLPEGTLLQQPLTAPYTVTNPETDQCRPGSLYITSASNFCQQYSIICTDLTTALAQRLFSVNKHKAERSALRGLLKSDATEVDGQSSECAYVSHLLQLRSQPSASTPDFRSRPWVYLRMHTALWTHVVSEVKTIESRVNNDHYRRVSVGWLLCCQDNSSKACVWREATATYTYAAFSTCVRAHGTALLPGSTNMSDVQAEFAFYSLNTKHLSNASAVKWCSLTGIENRVICWEMRPLPNGARLPSHRMCVNPESDYVPSSYRPLRRLLHAYVHHGPHARSLQRRARHAFDDSIRLAGERWTRISSSLRAGPGSVLEISSAQFLFEWEATRERQIREENGLWAELAFEMTKRLAKRMFRCQKRLEHNEQLHVWVRLARSVKRDHDHAAARSASPISNVSRTCVAAQFENAAACL